MTQIHTLDLQMCFEISTLHITLIIAKDDDKLCIDFANIVTMSLKWYEMHKIVPPWGRRGFKPRIRPPYPQRVVKGD